MTLRGYRSAVQSGKWILRQSGDILAKTPFQRARLREAVATACVYLSGPLAVQQIARTLGVTPERAAQKIRLGIKYMTKEGRLRPADGGDPQSPSDAPTHS